MHAVAKAYRPIAALGNFFQPFLLVLIRIYWGWMFFQAGLGKLQNIDQTAEFFESIDLFWPVFNAYFVGCVELIGGIFLFFGFISRLTGLILLIDMIVAYAVAHTEAFDQFFTDPSVFVSQEPFNYLLTAAIVFCFGPGVISIDWIGKKVFRGEKAYYGCHLLLGKSFWPLFGDRPIGVFADIAENRRSR